MKLTALVPRVFALVAAAGLLVLVGSRGSFLHALTSRATSAPRASTPPPVPTSSASASPAHAGSVGSAEAPAPALPAASAAPPASASARAGARTADGRVVLNEATEEDLAGLPGLGRGRARAVVELRTKLGKFGRVEQLLRVKGIGRKRLAKLRDLVVLNR